VTLDLAVLGTLVLFAALGARSGALRQLVFAAAAVLGWLAARELAAPVARGFGKTLPAALGRGLAGVLLFFAVLVLASFVGHLMLRWSGAGRLWGPADRALGAILGAAKAALAAWVLLSAFVVYGRPIGPLDLAGSDFAALARERNLFDAWKGPGSEALKALVRVARDPVGSARLLGDVDSRALLEDRRVQELIDEARSSGEKGAGSVLRSPRAAQLLSDPAFLQRLEKAQRKIEEADPGR
jgi:membrane protein required for colicin V production